VTQQQIAAECREREYEYFRGERSGAQRQRQDAHDQQRKQQETIAMQRVLHARPS